MQYVQLLQGHYTGQSLWAGNPSQQQTDIVDAYLIICSWYKVLLMGYQEYVLLQNTQSKGHPYSTKHKLLFSYHTNRGY